MLSLWSKEFYETDPTRDFVRGYTLQFARGAGAGQRGGHQRRRAACLPWGKEHHRVFRDLLHNRLRIGVACEDLPEEHNRVTLDPVLKDSHGIPAPKIDYVISENTQADDGTRHRPRDGYPDRGGRHRICITSRTVLNSPGHLLGTARMGTTRNGRWSTNGAAATM